MARPSSHGVSFLRLFLTYLSSVIQIDFWENREQICVPNTLKPERIEFNSHLCLIHFLFISNVRSVEIAKYHELGGS